MNSIEVADKENGWGEGIKQKDSGKNMQRIINRIFPLPRVLSLLRTPSQNSQSFFLKTIFPFPAALVIQF